MAKRHINTATGASGVRKAEKRPCPYGEFGIHTEDVELFEKLTTFRYGGARLASGSLVEDETEALKRLARAVQEEDFVELRQLIEERTDAPVFKKALLRRQLLQDKLDKLYKDYSKLEQEAESLAGAESFEAQLKLRDATLAYRDQFEELAVLKNQIDEYKVINAQAAQASAKLQKKHELAAGLYLEYTATTMGPLEAIGEYPIDSPEWHAARASGIGGSDVGAIMKVEEQWASANYYRVLNAKLGIESTNQREFDRDDPRTAIGRGNAWEEYIRQTIALKHPELNVAFCKTSFHHKDFPYRHANFDGLILADDGSVDEIIEIKTGSSPKVWGPEEAGLAGVPQSYRKQAVWYAMNAGAKGGRIVAMLDDSDYREYKFSLSDQAVQAEVAEITAATDEFWQKVQDKQASLKSGLEPVKRPRRRGFAAAKSLAEVSSTLAAYADITPTQATREVKAAMKAARALYGTGLTDDQKHEALMEVFSKHDPSTRKRPFIGVDIETTSLSPRTGRIIEVGVGTLSSDGAIETVNNASFDIPERAHKGIGIGSSDVHGITADAVRGRKTFDDPEEQKRLLKQLTSGVMVAHNAAFEDKFFAANLPGYIEAKQAGRIKILDTMLISKYTMPNSKNSTMESFAEDNGIAYEGAHSAPQDAIMMLKALQTVQQQIHQEKKVKVQAISKASRKQAQATIEERSFD